MMPRTVKSWSWIGAFIAFVVAASIAQHHDGTGMISERLKRSTTVRSKHPLRAGRLAGDYS